MSTCWILCKIFSMWLQRDYKCTVKDSWMPEEWNSFCRRTYKNDSDSSVSKKKKKKITEILLMKIWELGISPASKTQGKSRMFNKNKYFFKDALWMCCCSTVYKAKISIMEGCIKEHEVGVFQSSLTQKIICILLTFLHIYWNRCENCHQRWYWLI